MRLICAGVLALAVGGYVAYTQFIKAAPKDNEAEKLKTLKKKFTDDFDELANRFQKAETSAEKKGIQSEAKELAVLTAGKVLKIAEAHPKSETAFDAAEFAVTRLATIGGAGPDLDKLLGIVAEHHLNNPKVKDLLLVVGRAGPGGEKFLQTAGEKANDKTVRGTSLYILGMSYAEQADDATSDKATAELTAKAIDYLQKAAKEAPDVKVDEELTVAKAADAEITALKTLSIGSPAPDVEGTDVHTGKKIKLSSLKGKVVLLDIWATWCGPCRAMIPHERKMVDKLKGKPFELISVSVDEKKDTLTKFVEKEPMPWTHWWDNGEENPLVKTLRVKAFPTLYLIDAKGVIRKKWIGVPDGDPDSPAVENAVEELLKDAGKG